MTISQVDLTQVNTFLSKAKDWPWRIIAVLIVVSFILSSAVSTILGYMVMSQTGRVSVGNEDKDIATEFSSGPTLNESEVNKILERNLFNSEGQIGDDSSAPSEAGKIAKTQLPLKIIGLIYGGDPKNGIVTIENTEKKTINSFLVGDIVAPDATIFEIQPTQILIENQGRQEYLALDEVEIRRSSRNAKKTSKAKTPASLSGSSFATEPPPDSYKEEGFERKGFGIEMSADYKSRLLGPEFSNVLQDAKASPNMVDGVLKGWKLDRIRKNSIFEKFGIQNGDVVEEINGILLTDAGQAVKTLTGLKNEPDFEIRLIRNGKPYTINAKVK